MLKAFLIELKSHRYNGTSAPRIVLVSPTPAEKPHGHLNGQIQSYAKAMQKVAQAENVGFADVSKSAALLASSPQSPVTINGVHLNAQGYRLFAEDLFRATFDETAPTLNEGLRVAVVEKETKFFQYYRPLNYYYIKGGRAEPYGVINFPGELEKLKQMVGNRDQLIWDIAAGKKLVRQQAVSLAVSALVDDSNTRPLPSITGDRPVNEWLSAADELKAFKIDPRFEVTCFASEEDFPDFVKPIAMRFDAKGRLWVSTSTTYPQILPGQEPEDKILILEDTNQDGKADKC
ncbi:MAG TPA: hypothetical protein DCP71_02685, partial [Verrucomicrobiales bacterium]|nr:hypothetical protein [Verrucomicrobiales bacterium]